MKKDISIHFAGVPENSLYKDEKFGRVVDEPRWLGGLISGRFLGEADKGVFQVPEYFSTILKYSSSYDTSSCMLPKPLKVFQQICKFLFFCYRTFEEKFLIGRG